MMCEALKFRNTFQMPLSCCSNSGVCVLIRRSLWAKKNKPNNPQPKEWAKKDYQGLHQEWKVWNCKLFWKGSAFHFLQCRCWF